MKRVFVNGYGSIGRRVAALVGRDGEVELAGVGKASARGLEGALADGWRVHVPEAALAGLAGRGVAGSIESALDSCDLVIDCTPSGTGYENKVSLYEPRGLMAIYQGGETTHGRTAVSDTLFSSRTNYESAIGKRHVMQGSCNVTGIGKVARPLAEAFAGRITRLDVTLIRRWADIEQGGEIPDTIEMTPSPHHGEDVRAHMGDAVPVHVRAVKVPTRQMHVHVLDARFAGEAPAPADIHAALAGERAVAVLWGARGTREIREFAGSTDALADTNMVHVHAEMTASRGDTAQVVYSDDQTGIVIPENHMLMQAMLFGRPHAEALARTESLFGLDTKKAALEARFSREGAQS
ncbi:MAG: type II glyceraldehyde-3-phosphate dehydrogenase [Thaumarchaeota archaeon S15]|nr:MAG: type II glyceraldehyde-3-phosphate dehydrogenase [Thaumarchaeota archaeon S15]